MFLICASVNTYDPVETSVLFMIFIYKKKKKWFEESLQWYNAQVPHVEQDVLSFPEHTSLSLRFKDSDYSFGIFKLFWLNKWRNTDVDSAFLSPISPWSQVTVCENQE